MMASSFVEYISGLSQIYEQLTKKLDELSLENARLQRALRSRETAIRETHIKAEETHESIGDETVAQTVACSSPSKKLLVTQDPAAEQVLEDSKMSVASSIHFPSKLAEEVSEPCCLADTALNRETSDTDTEFRPNMSANTSAACANSEVLHHVSFDRNIIEEHEADMLTDLSNLAGVTSRWEGLVERVIVFMHRFRYALKACWTNKDLPEKQKELMHALIVELGRTLQEQDPIIQAWFGQKRKNFLGTFGGDFLGKRAGQRRSVRQSTAMEARRMSFSLGDNRQMTENWEPCILHPLSASRVCWSLLGVLGVAYDGVILSLSVFDPSPSGAAVAIEWALRIFWILDIAVCFRTGFYVKSRYEDRPKVIARKYAKTWFCFDVIALLPDLIIACFGLEQSHSKTLRWLRALKVLRLIRIGKATVLFKSLMESVNSPSIILLIHITKYCFLLMCWVHLIGCAWFALGKGGSNEENSWIIKAGVDKFSLPQTYLISIQWGLSQLQGSTDVYSSFKEQELVFTIVVVAFSIFIMAVFISNVTNMLIQIQTTWDEKSQQMRALQEYLHVHQVSGDVSESVRKYVAAKMKIESRLQLDEAEVLEPLPTNLRRSLLVQVRGPMVIVRNPVFIAIQRILPACFDAICCDLLEPFFVEPDRLVFSYGEISYQTYFHVGGELFYEPIDNPALKELLEIFGDIRRLGVEAEEEFDNKKTTVDTSDMVRLQTTRKSRDNHFEKQFMRERLRASGAMFPSIEISRSQPISETAMWTSWNHLGDLYAASHTAFLTLQSSKFSLLIDFDRSLGSLCAPQAVRICRILNSGKYNISDLFTSNDALGILWSFGEVEADKPALIRTRTGTRLSAALSR